MKLSRISHVRGISYMVLLLVASIFITDVLPCLAADQTEFEKGLVLLTESDFAKKELGIDKINTFNDPVKTKEIFNALLKDRLFYVKKDKTVVIGEEGDSLYNITSVLTEEKLAPINKRKLKKISLNNKLRQTIKSSIAQLDLSHPESQVRLEAAKRLLEEPDPSTVSLLTNRLSAENDSEVRETLLLALAMSQLKDADLDKRITALDNLKGSLNPAVRFAVVDLIKNEADEKLKKDAEQMLRDIDSRISFFGWAETLFFGLSMGSVLVLAAIGLAITFGVIGVINMAHGELIMIGAYTTYVIQQLMPESIGLSLFIAIPAAFMVSGLTGIVIEKSVIRFLYGRPLETLLATYGLSLILQQAVRSIFSPLNRTVITPDWMSGSLAINSIFSLTINRLSILIFCGLVFAGLFMIMKKTSIGLQVRAVSQNRDMARAMGVRAARVDALTFGLGSGIAGIAGVALSQLTNVGPNLGQAYIIDSFMVVVFGGVGNLWGTMLGGLSLGIANKFIEPWAGAVLAKIIILVFIILFIQKRPQGLFPQKGRVA
nr:urea ABC transporter permease subunit UrtB [Desulfobulbaceae bacterium]